MQADSPPNPVTHLSSAPLRRNAGRCAHGASGGSGRGQASEFGMALVVRRVPCAAETMAEWSGSRSFTTRRLPARVLTCAKTPRPGAFVVSAIPIRRMLVGGTGRARAMTDERLGRKPVASDGLQQPSCAVRCATIRATLRTASRSSHETRSPPAYPRERRGVEVRLDVLRSPCRRDSSSVAASVGEA